MALRLWTWIKRSWSIRRKANSENCDYFVSLHMNSSTNKTSKLYNLANNISTNISNKINTPNSGVKISKDFSVLRKTKMHALLIEINNTILGA